MDNSQLWAKPDQTLVVTFDELSSYTGGRGGEGSSNTVSETVMSS